MEECSLLDSRLDIRDGTSNLHNIHFLVKHIEEHLRYVLSPFRLFASGWQRRLF